MASTLFWVIVGVLSIILVMKSAGYAIGSIARYARKTGLSYYFVGLLIVSIGTSLPEIFTAIIASLEGNAPLMLGDAMGATLVDVALVLGTVGIIAKSMKISKKEIRIPIWKTMFIVLLIPVLALDGDLTRFDGAILLLASLYYYGINIYKEIKHQHIHKNIPLNFVWRETFIFGANIAMLIFGAQLLVLSASELSTVIGIPEYIFGVLVLGLCTTTPEFTVEIKSLLQGKAAIAFGDIFGSVITNLSLVVGIGVMISPILVDKVAVLTVAAFLVPAVFISLMFMRSGLMNIRRGLLLVLFYILFVIYELYVLGVF